MVRAWIFTGVILPSVSPFKQFSRATQCLWRVSNILRREPAFQSFCVRYQLNRKSTTQYNLLQRTTVWTRHGSLWLQSALAPYLFLILPFLHVSFYIGSPHLRVASIDLLPRDAIFFNEVLPDLSVPGARIWDWHRSSVC